MTVLFHEQNEITVAKLSGEIDGTTAPGIQEAFKPILMKNKAVVIDMQEVTFMSSAGLRMLLYVYRQTEANNCRIALSALEEQIKDTMSITGFIGFFELYDSLELALEAFKEAS